MSEEIAADRAAELAAIRARATGAMYEYGEEVALPRVRQCPGARLLRRQPHARQRACESLAPAAP